MNILSLFCSAGSVGVGRSGDFLGRWGGCGVAVAVLGVGGVSCFTVVWVLGGVWLLGF